MELPILRRARLPEEWVWRGEGIGTSVLGLLIPFFIVEALEPREGKWLGQAAQLLRAVVRPRCSSCSRRCPLGIDPLHLGHPGPPALQYGELLVAGSRSADTHTSPGLLPGPPSGPQGQEHSCQSGQAHRLGDRQNAWWDCSSTRVRA